MSPTTLNQRMNTTSDAVAPSGGRRGVVRLYTVFVLVVLAFLLSAQCAYAAVNLNLQGNPSGVTISPSGANYTSSMGTMNALGVGTPATGVTVIQLSNGALYYTPYQLIAVGGLGASDSAYVTAYVSTNFTHTAALLLESCPTTSSCNTSGSFSAMSANSAAPTTVIAQPGMPKNSARTAGLAIFLPDNNGASAYTGNDSVVITFNAYKNSNNSLIDTTTLTLNPETLQDAVRLNLATNASGLTVTSASDYSMNFGNVNALGINPGANLSTSAQAGGIIYSTPYDLKPAFTGFSSTTATIKVCVSTTFTHSAILVLEDSSTGSGGSFSNISTACGAASSLTAAASSRSTITRYLGLFVSNVNGATSFRGTDTATLTYTLTVP